MRRRTIAVAAGFALLTLLPAPGQAQQTPAAPQASAASLPGTLTARAYKPAPSDLTVFVSPYDDSDLNLKLKADFESRLTGKGGTPVRAEAAAALLFLFESEVVPAEQVPRGPSLGSATVNESGAEVSVNVWSSSQDSVLGGRQEAAPVGASVFHINAVLRERRSGELVWQGDAYYVLDGPETERVARALVAPLVDKMGQSVARETFEIE